MHRNQMNGDRASLEFGIMYTDGRAPRRNTSDVGNPGRCRWKAGSFLHRGRYSVVGISEGRGPTESLTDQRIAGQGKAKTQMFEPSPQERIWRQIRYEWASNHWFPDLDQTWIAIRDTSRRWSLEKIRRLCNIH